jgi:hypothetical protein
MDDMNTSGSGDDLRPLPDDSELASLLGDDFGDGVKNLALDGHAVLHDLPSAHRKKHPQPPPVVAAPVVDVASVYGRRVVHQKETGPVYDLRAVSEVFTDSSGSWVKVTPEWRWYAWISTPAEARPEACPRATALPTTNVWLEQYPVHEEQTGG